MGNALEFTSDNFQSEVLEATVPVVVDFSATWCGPCQQLAPAMEELASEYQGKVKIGKVDVDQSQDLANAYDVLSVPTVLFFKNGQLVDSLIGLHPRNVYRSKIEALLGE